MTRLAMHGSRLGTNLSRSGRDRAVYRRWARAMCIIDFLIFAVLLIGVSLYDLRTNQIADHVRAIGSDAPSNLQTTAVIRKGG